MFQKNPQGKKNTQKCVKTSLSTSLHPPSPTPNPGHLDSFSILQFILLRRFGDVILPMDVTPLNTTQMLPIPPAPSTSEKRWQKTRTPEDVPTKKTTMETMKSCPKQKKMKLSPKIPLYLSISLFLLHTPNRVSLFFWGERKHSTQHWTTTTPPTPNPPASHLVDHHAATLLHHPIVRQPWRRRFETWRHTPGSDLFSDRLKFSLVPKKRQGKLWTKIHAKEKMGESLELFFLKIATIFF